MRGTIRLISRCRLGGPRVDRPHGPPQVHGAAGSFRGDRKLLDDFCNLFFRI